MGEELQLEGNLCSHKGEFPGFLSCQQFSSFYTSQLIDLVQVLTPLP